MGDDAYVGSGTDWKEIEAANKLQLFAERVARRATYGRGVNEVFANGKVTGTWSERGSSTQAGSMICVDYLPATNSLYSISSGNNLWKGDLAGNNWTPVNDYISFNNRL